MRARDRRDAVPTGLLAGDPAVAIVVVARERVVTDATTTVGTARGRSGRRAHHRLKRRALAGTEDSIEGRRFSPIDGEPVGPADLEHPCCEPATVAGRDPLRGVLAALLVAVHPG